MNYSIVLKVLSLLLGILALAFSICAGVSLFYSSDPSEPEALKSWICMIALTLMLSASFWLPSRNAPKKLFRKEAMCIVGVGWIVASLVGAVPYILILGCGFADALFESTSGITTTGASVFSNLDSFPNSLMFWRMLSHWIGGLGVVVFFVVILSFLGAGAKTLFSNENSNASAGMETARIRTGSLRILGIYLAISTAAAVSFRLCGIGWFDSICHMFSTVSTGGFTIYQDGTARYSNHALEWMTTLFMFIGGTSFAVITAALAGKFRTVFRNTEFKTYIVILVLASAVIAFAVHQDEDISVYNWNDAIRMSAFQCVSILTTTGFCIADYQQWMPFAHAIFFVSAILGGCAGSTSGGIKIVRAVAAIKICKRNVETSLRPKLVRNISINGKTLDEDDANNIMSFIVLYASLVVAGVAAISLLERNISLTGCIASVVACMGNSGAGLNEVGPSQTYGFFCGASKCVLSMVMIMGRLEIFALLALFMPSLWTKFK